MPEAVCRGAAGRQREICRRRVYDEPYQDGYPAQQGHHLTAAASVSPAAGPPALLRSEQNLERQDHPRGAVQEEVEPVDGADQPAAGEHDKFLDQVRWPIRGQAKGQAEEYGRTPGQRIKQLLHVPSISCRRRQITPAFLFPCEDRSIIIKAQLFTAGTQPAEKEISDETYGRFMHGAGSGAFGYGGIRVQQKTGGLCPGREARGRTGRQYAGRQVGDHQLP